MSRPRATLGDRQYLSPAAVMGRLLVCQSCSALVDVIEIPHTWINPDEYTCGECLQPVEIPSAHTEPPAPPARRDMSTYDPATEPIAF